MSRNIALTQVVQWDDGNATHVEDYLAAEEPLEIRAGRHSLGVTLRTPGDDEELVAGFLFTEGIISRREDLVALRVPGNSSPERNLVRATLSRNVRLPAGGAARRFSAGSACGVCGKASITQLRQRGLRRPEAASLFDPEMLCQMPPRRIRLFLAEPAGCTRRHCSHQAANCLFCVRTLADTMPWTKQSVGHFSMAAYLLAVTSSLSAVAAGSRLCKRRSPPAFRC